MNNDNQDLHQFLFKKASVWHRIGAFIIDYMIIILLVLLFTFIFLFIQSVVTVIEINSVIFIIFVTSMFFLLYFFRDFHKGQSIGKRALGIGVRDINDNFLVPSVTRLFLRQIFTFIWCIEFFVMIFNRENRKIGDLIVGTAVYDIREYDNFMINVKRLEYIKQTQDTENVTEINQMQMIKIEPNNINIKRTAIIIGCVILFFMIAFIGITSIFRNHPAHHVATDYIRVNNEIISAIGEVQRFGFVPQGNVSTSPGRGDANFIIITWGEHGAARIYITLQMRDGNDWEVVMFNFRLLE